MGKKSINLYHVSDSKEKSKRWVKEKLDKKNEKICDGFVGTIVLVCVGVFIIDFLKVHRNIVTDQLSSENMKNLLGLYPHHLVPNLLVATVSHISLYHLISNLFMLFLLDRLIRSKYSWLTILSTLIISSLVGGIITVVVSPQIVSMGLSGGIFGLLGLFLISYTSGKGIFSKDNIVILGIVSVIVYYTFTNPQINAVAHMTGLVIGILSGIISVDRRQRRKQNA